jgi:hypothetical protein
MINDTNYYGVGTNFCEWDYIQEIIKELAFDGYTQLHVVSMTQEWDYRDKVVLSKDKRNVIIGLSDEYMTDNVPQEWKDNATVFKAYLLPEQETGNVHSFPLGYNKKHKKLVNRPIKDRPIDVFFAGHMVSSNRQRYMNKVIEFFRDMPSNERPYIDFNITRGFNIGLDADTYSEKLHQSKIVVCPAGNVSMETFRHYEAMRSGAIVVSPNLPQTKIYKDAVICQVDDWDANVGSVIMELLSDLDMLQLIQERQQQTYNNRFTAKSIAKYINELLPTTK